MNNLHEAAQTVLDSLSTTDYKTIGDFFLICEDVRDNLRAAKQIAFAALLARGAA